MPGSGLSVAQTTASEPQIENVVEHSNTTDAYSPNCSTESNEHSRLIDLFQDRSDRHDRAPAQRLRYHRPLDELTSKRDILAAWLAPTSPKTRSSAAAWNMLATRVRAAIDDLGYSPNSSCSDCSSKTSRSPTGMSNPAADSTARPASRRRLSRQSASPRPPRADDCAGAPQLTRPRTSRHPVPAVRYLKANPLIIPSKRGSSLATRQVPGGRATTENTNAHERKSNLSCATRSKLGLLRGGMILPIGSTTLNLDIDVTAYLQGHRSAQHLRRGGVGAAAATARSSIRKFQHTPSHCCRMQHGILDRAADSSCVLRDYYDRVQQINSINKTIDHLTAEFGLSVEFVADEPGPNDGLSYERIRQLIAKAQRSIVFVDFWAEGSIHRIGQDNVRIRRAAYYDEIIKQIESRQRNHGDGPPFHRRIVQVSRLLSPASRLSLPGDDYFLSYISQCLDLQDQAPRTTVIKICRAQVYLHFAIIDDRYVVMPILTAGQGQTTVKRHGALIFEDHVGYLVRELQNIYSMLDAAAQPLLRAQVHLAEQ